MNAFFRQLNNINPLLVVKFEAMLYQNADKYIKDYNGGKWDSQSMKNGSYALICPDGPVHLVNADNYTDLETDAKTAGVALTLITLNHLIWKLHHEERHGECHSVNTLWQLVQDGAYSKNLTFDQAALSSFLD